jgi:ABC-type transport system involved in cytochrome bd biosynthesis fused ATPase/permease subunit
VKLKAGNCQLLVCNKTARQFKPIITITHAHQILVMEAGSIIERGTHESLLKDGQRYAEMWRVQQSQIHS